MRAIGSIMLIFGFAGTLLFGVQAIQDAESLSTLSSDIKTNTADMTPFIVSGALLIIGLFLSRSKKRKVS